MAFVPFVVLRGRWRSGCARFSVLVLALGTIAAALLSSAAAQDTPSQLQKLLRNDLAFAPGQISQVERDGITAKILASPRNEIAAATAARIHSSQEFFLSAFRDIEQYKKNEVVLAVRKFSNPPRIEDLSDLSLLPQEINDLKNCRAGQCNFKLSREQILYLRGRVDWNSPDSARQATVALREALLEYLQHYAAQGNRGMISYNDKDHSPESRAQFEQLLEQSRYLAEYAPRFHDYLLHFPDAAPPSVENFFYWSKESYGHNLKPIITITHVTIYRQEAAPGVLISSKQIYASHYFDSSLGLTMLFPAAKTDLAPSFYVVYVNRSQIDLLKRWYSGLAHASIASNVRGSMNANMLKTKEKVERQYVASQPDRTAAPAISAGHPGRQP